MMCFFGFVDLNNSVLRGSRCGLSAPGLMYPCCTLLEPLVLSCCTYAASNMAGVGVQYPSYQQRETFEISFCKIQQTKLKKSMEKKSTILKQSVV